MGKRGPKPDPEIAKRNARIAKLYRDSDIELGDLGARFRLHPNSISKIVRDAGIPVRIPKRGRPAPVQPPVARVSPGEVLADLPKDRTFCSQCDLLRWPNEVAACASPWCKAKEAAQ